MSDWYKFYKKRVNSTYQIYFERRYKEFLEEIVKCKPDVIYEAGCGIASISKYFTKYGIDCKGFDLNPDMVKLAKINCPQGRFFVGDILNEQRSTNELIITHGVLEHFHDEQIQSILRRFPNSIHYVPLSSYETQSFGDERLMDRWGWNDKFSIKDILTFNDGYDMCFKSNYSI